MKIVQTRLIASLLILDNVTYKFEFRPFGRNFLRSLTTSHGNWDIRESIIIRLIDDAGRVGFGEIAPISWFGSETLAQALNFCHQLPQEITAKAIFTIPDDLPACQFAFESALAELDNNQCPMPNAPCPMLNYSALLPAKEAALNAWQNLWKEGYRTFKWKIGVDAIAQELAIFDLLIRSLPDTAKLRLDANGGLSYSEAKLWLENCDEFSEKMEFIEQPLAVTELAGMLQLSQIYKTAIALDESVATIAQLNAAYQQGWRGIFVIKPAIAGSPSKLRQFCRQHNIDAVFSSVFETAIGRKAALQLAAELSQHNRAVGFGTNHWFEQQEDTWLESLW
ncbi:o-succinylbenzoate synthase [Calothrix sp. FACHB-1219]|uniref:o-succinylbenzoate synthase n=1 Tax=unclassified Calothrix TaxID=2619626 RepID=UPI0016879D58|nr:MULTISPECIES: o-succinylbenzoate synthase [unclassified Calothrix]MBD2201507.1 o-succinylbenzoate synthase [Calothrix sp. FACHB-168]MBD2215939.1 o-succinylbenzoate synthase [Calothrix sp. FACHB-1219]